MKELTENLTSSFDFVDLSNYGKTWHYKEEEIFSWYLTHGRVVFSKVFSEKLYVEGYKKCALSMNSFTGELALLFTRENVANGLPIRFRKDKSCTAVINSMPLIKALVDKLNLKGKNGQLKLGKNKSKSDVAIFRMILTDGDEEK